VKQEGKYLLTGTFAQCLIDGWRRCSRNEGAATEPVLRDIPALLSNNLQNGRSVVVISDRDPSRRAGGAGTEWCRSLLGWCESEWRA
jgi:hypothetical protein